MTAPEDDIQPRNADSNGERQVAESKAKRMTRAVFDAGILPHSFSERDHAYTLLRPGYRIKGGKEYVENIARMNVGHIIMDVPPQNTLRSQLGFPDPQIEDERTRIRDSERAKVMTKIADHMMDYVEDAQATIEALYDLDKSIGDSHPGHELLGTLLVDPRPEIHHAIATLVRLYETKQYIAKGSTLEGRLDTDLVAMETEEAEQRIAEGIRDLTVGEARKELTEALRLEIGRKDFWTDQLLGHPSQPKRPVPLGIAGEYDEHAVQKRYGVVATDNPLLRGRILRRMSLIELGGAVSTVEDEKK